MPPYQSQANTISSNPSRHVDETQTNTARNVKINDSQTETLPTRSRDDASNTVGESDEITPEEAERAGLPEQKHAGAVGYGPNYANRRATLGDKITGIKEQLVGKVTNNPELAQKGHDRKTGELKRKAGQEHEIEPFVVDEETSPTSSPGLNTDVPPTSTDINGSSTRGLRTEGIGGTSNDDPDISTGKSNSSDDSSYLKMM